MFDNLGRGGSLLLRKSLETSVILSQKRFAGAPRRSLTDEFAVAGKV
jgi:hypothetical protein